MANINKLELRQCLKKQEPAADKCLRENPTEQKKVMRICSKNAAKEHHKSRSEIDKDFIKRECDNCAKITYRSSNAKKACYKYMYKNFKT